MTFHPMFWNLSISDSIGMALQIWLYNSVFDYNAKIVENDTNHSYKMCEVTLALL